MDNMKFDTIDEALDDIRQGRMIIVIDDEDREDEGDFIAAADHVTTEMVNFITREARGLLCVAVTMDRARSCSLTPWFREILPSMKPILRFRSMP